MNKNKSKSKKPDSSQGSKESQEDAGHDKQSTLGSSKENGIKSPSGASQPNKPATTAWFVNEIQHMMHGFGDCKKPLVESASLIEEMVHQQMITLTHKAADVAAMRSARNIGIEDFIFLMRKDKVKLKRLIQYMSVKDMKSNICKSTAEEDESGVEQGESKQVARKKRKMCYDFLSSIDQTGELTALFEDDGIDEIKRERLLRAELQTREMDTQQYMDFHESRQSSFVPRYKCQKFKDWLMLGVNTDLKPNPPAIEVLAYLAYETVAQIVDMAFLVRRDNEARVDDPLAQVMPAVCVARDVTSLSSSLPASSSSSTSSNNNTTSPQQPTSPTNTGALSNPTCVTSPSSAQSSNVNKNKSKKKKRVYPGWKDFHSSEAIQPAEIREALRRFTQPTGPFADFSKRPLVSCKPSLCC